ncbi:hypothetical protein ACFLZM_04725 [Thermodesulfobacteriota bacterium]
MKKELLDINKELKALSKKVEKLIAAASTEKPKVTKAKPAKKIVPEKKMSAAAIVLGIIKRSRKGVAKETLKKKTGFEDQKLYNVVSMLKKQGKVNNPGKGFYVKG